MTDLQAVELFHLHFVRRLCAGPDVNCFAIKGGCNLRFFFDSVRYSEDIDLDVKHLGVGTLKKKVSNILDAPALKSPLKSRGIQVVEWSAPKQTETTQRWKVSLSVEQQPLPLHTKIEFSRREGGEAAVVETIAPGVLAEHREMAVVAPHYPLATAIRQKVGALVGRSTVQARDVFDLAFLLSKAGGSVEALQPVKPLLEKAIDRAMEVVFDEFTSQVVSYLKPDLMESLGSRANWDALQSQLVDTLERAAR